MSMSAVNELEHRKANGGRLSPLEVVTLKSGSERAASELAILYDRSRKHVDLIEERRALRTERDRLQAENARLREALAEAQQDERDEHNNSLGLMEKLMDALGALKPFAELYEILQADDGKVETQGKLSDLQRAAELVAAHPEPKP
jgi:hypothetical protein